MPIHAVTGWARVTQARAHGEEIMGTRRGAYTEEPGTVTGIMVKVLPPTVAGRLYPRYEDEVGFLVVESRVQKPWLFGVDIDGRIVFDLDSQRRLMNFDLHIPKTRWKIGLDDEAPSVARPGDLVFSPETTAIQSFSLDLEIRTDSSRRRARIEIGTRQPNRLVALSPSCSALLAGDELVGFTIKDFA